MSKWDVGPLEDLPFLSAPLPPPGFQSDVPPSWDDKAIVSEEGAEGELGECMAEPEPGAPLGWGCCSAFLLTPVLWAGVPPPVMAQIFVWSTEVTSVEEGVVEEEVEGARDGWRTSISSWAENLSRRLWMQPCEAGVSGWVGVTRTKQVVADRERQGAMCGSAGYVSTAVIR